jgi:hypothetical protein
VRPDSALLFRVPASLLTASVRAAASIGGLDRFRENNWKHFEDSVRKEPVESAVPVQPQQRIDGVVALIMAIDGATRNENHASAWSGPGFILI